VAQARQDNWQYFPQGSNHVTVGEGYFVNTPNTDDSPNRYANAFLVNQKEARNTLGLILTDVMIDFVASGKYAQSRNYREFMFHNFGQVTLTLKGICRNQKDYGKIAEYVRESHRLAVSSTEQIDSPLIALSIRPGGYNTRRGEKGRHDGIEVEGHIESFSRRHERWINAPTYQFQFVVEKWSSGLGLEDPSSHALLLKSFSELITKGKGDQFADSGFGTAGFVKDPDPDPGAGALNIAANAVLTPGPNGELRPN
jgi:hypothetical protein